MYPKVYHFLLVCLLWGIGQFAFAQMTISGKITDAKTGEALIGATITEQGTTNAAITDFDGKYSLTVKNTIGAIVVTYAGYAEMVVPVTRTGTFDVALKEITTELEAIQVTTGRRRERVMDAPNAISVIEQKAIKNQIVATPTDYLRDASGVDVIKTGIVGANIAVRGFNNIFSGGLLSLVDGRVTALPSLRVNTQYMISSNPGDIQRIEVLKGPASAMYGPNSANGVVHFITESPLDMPERFRTTISVAGGLRSKLDTVLIYTPGATDNLSDDGGKWAYATSLRHAGKLMDKKDGLKIGYKISGKWFEGNEWVYKDPFEPANIVKGKQTADGRVIFLSDGTERLQTEVLADPALLALVDSVPNNRNTQNNIYNGDARIDFRFNKHTELIFSGGVNSATGVELTGLGAAQATDWKYIYGQVRFIHRNWYAQAYINNSNSGETYLLRDGNSLIDKSNFISAQLQHSSQFMKEKLKLIYGIDALLTRPGTKGSINGRNEDSDNINEFGAYLQADYKISEKLNILAALRGDKHSFVDDPFFSPRAAITYKPSPKHAIRATYNRAFSSPSALNLSLDILSGRLPTGIDVRGVGNRGGFYFQRDDAGLPQYRTPFAPLAGGTTDQYYSLGNMNINNVTYGIAVDLLADGLKAISSQFGIDPTIVDGIITNIIPTQLTGSVPNVLRTFTTIPSNPFGDVEDPSTVVDIAPIKNSPTQTIELGYKGLIKDRLAVTLDVYKTDITDFVTALAVRTPNVFLDPTAVAADIQAEIAANMADPANGLYKVIVTAVLDTAETIQGIYVGGNNDGDATEELVRLISTAAGRIPFGTVSPTNQNDPAMLLVYSNFGDVTVYGAEMGLNYYITDGFKVGTTLAFVSDDEFETEGRTVSLNASPLKIGLSADYRLDKIGLDLGLRYRWQKGFNANSGVYAGRVHDISLLDLNIGYALPFSKNTQISLSMQNVLDKQQQMFVGAPRLGRFTLLQIAHTFSSK